MQGKHFWIPQTVNNDDKEINRTEFLNNILTSILILKYYSVKYSQLICT